jgi:hypothetical protein
VSPSDFVVGTYPFNVVFAGWMEKLLGHIIIESLPHLGGCYVIRTRRKIGISAALS